MRRALILSAAIFFAWAAAASAAVLVEAIPKHLSCGDAITPGVYAQPGTSGSRRVTVKAVDGRTGRVWWRRSVVAPHHWRRWVLPSGRRGQCGVTRIVYRSPRFTVRYTVRFRGEGV